MREIKARHVGNGLYEVFVDGKKYGVPCELDRLGMIYDDMVKNSDGNED